MSVAVLGGGSNTIVPDEGYDGLVIHMAIDALEFDGGASSTRARAFPGNESSTAPSSRVGPASSASRAFQVPPAQRQFRTWAHTARRCRGHRRASASSPRHARLRGARAPEDLRLRLSRQPVQADPDAFIVSGGALCPPPWRGGDGSLRGAQAHVVGASLAAIRGAVLDLRRRKSMVIEPDDPESPKRRLVLPQSDRTRSRSRAGRRTGGPRRSSSPRLTTFLATQRRSAK